MVVNDCYMVFHFYFADKHEISARKLIQLVFSDISTSVHDLKCYNL